METARKLVLEKENGDVIRTFLLIGPDAHIIERKDTKRLEIVPSLEDLYRRKIKFNDLGQIRRENLDHLDFDIPGVGKIKAAAPQLKVVKDPELEDENRKSWYGALAFTLLFFVGLFSFLFSARVQNVDLVEEQKQEVVQIIKKLTPPKPTAQKVDASAVSKAETAKQAPTKTGAVKRMGALGVLGSMKNSNQRGGLNLGAAQTTAGPGLGGNAGSGGVQTNIYSKGLVAAPLGAGGNVKGAGGYGTKGKGGGQAGYGTTSLLGATGGTSMPLASEASIGGGLDRDAIAAVINRNLGQIRFCYEQGLQGDPSLAGRVAVGFTIGGTGMVKSAAVENSSLNSKVVEDCIVLRLKGWKFPLTENGVDVKVSYPFVLRRAGQG